MSRVAVTLDEHAHNELARRAQAAQEPVARTAARLIRDGLLSTEAPAAGEPARTVRRRGEQASDRPGMPAWIEPLDEHMLWRRELWGAVTALTQRYPRALGALAADWWTDRALVEILGALTAWRSQLDTDQNPDPRAELLFHDRLQLLQRELTQAADPTAARFAGGPPPSEWVT